MSLGRVNSGTNHSVKGLGNNQKSLASLLSEQHFLAWKGETLQLPFTVYHDLEVSVHKEYFVTGCSSGYQLTSH